MVKVFEGKQMMHGTLIFRVERRWFNMPQVSV